MARASAFMDQPGPYETGGEFGPVPAASEVIEGGSVEAVAALPPPSPRAAFDRIDDIEARESGRERHLADLTRRIDELERLVAELKALVGTPREVQP